MRQSSRDELMQVVGELKSRYSTQRADAIAAVQGAWELVYSSEPLFLATPFWWGLGEVLRAAAGEDLTRGFLGVVKGLSEGPMSATYGAVLQVINGTNVTSDVGLGLFNAVQVTLLTEATLASADGGAGETTLALQRTRVLGSPMRALDSVDIPIGTGLGGAAALTGTALPAGGAPLPRLRTLHAGPRLRINRLLAGADEPASSQISIFKRI